MGHILKNKNLALQIDMPLEGYQNSRFDWTGKIVQLYYKGTQLTTVEDFNCENEHRYGKGFYNEFGIDTALGFEETNEGDWFHKIGVGLLQKEGTHYDFQKSYKIKAATFSTRIELQAFFMSCIAPNVHGYAYQLHKEIVLQEAGFNINYTLMNTGQKSIRTDEYAHNFMAFNQAEIDTNYQLKLPFNLHPTFFGETVNLEKAIRIGTKEFTVNHHPKKQFFFSTLSGKKPVEASWELLHKSQKIGIRERLNFKSNKINLWGWSHVISPEIFHEINIAPNETAQWTRTYEIFEL